MRHNEEFRVRVRKTALSSVTGLQVKHYKVEVEVYQVSLTDWNKEHPKREVRAGDHLVEVNGVRGPSSRDLLEAFQSFLTLDLVFVRNS